MVARPGTFQASFNAGELAPAVWGRSDIKQFYSGASLMRNCEPVPQGGFAALPGTVDTGAVRGPLSAAGGALVTSPGPHAGPAEVARLTLPGLTAIGVVDVLGLAASAAVIGLQVEYSQDGVTFAALGPVFPAGTTARDRRRAATPGRPVAAQFLRLMLTLTPAAPVTFALADFQAFAEQIGPPGAAKQFEFTYSVEKSFTVLLTPGNADLYEGDLFLGAAKIAGDAVQIAGMKREQRLDTMHLWHPDLAPQRLKRRETDRDWSCEPAPFENVANVDLGSTYGNVVTDIWAITIRWSSGPAGLALELTVNGEDTTAVALADATPGVPDWAGFKTALKAAIEALPSVNAGIVVTDLSSTSSQVIYVEFAGDGNAGNRFTMAARINNVTYAAASVSHPQIGEPGGEPIMSVFRGWPATGQFYQDRLWQAGFKSEPGALLGSVTGEYLDLNTRIESASGGILFRLDTSGAERIEHLMRSRHLVIFTGEAEYYVSDRAIVRSTPPNVAESSRNGVAAAIKPVENEGGLLYVGRSRAQLFACSYSDVSQKYDSESISLLASHLVRDIAGMAIQRASRATDAARLYLPRDDGVMAVGVFIRNQDVAAFVRYETDGLIRDACVDGAGRVFLLVDRPVGAGRRMFRERLDEAAVLHQQKTVAFVLPSAVVTGLEAYEGRMIWAEADGYFDRAYRVSGGQITLDQPAGTVTLGRWTAPSAKTLPLPRLVGERTQLARPVRVHTVRARLAGATSLAIGANGGPARDVALVRAGDVSDQPVPPCFAAITATGLAGWSDEGIVEFSQTRPGRFAVRDVTLEART